MIAPESEPEDVEPEQHPESPPESHPHPQPGSNAESGSCSESATSIDDNLTNASDVVNVVVLSSETDRWNKGRVGVVGRSGAGKSCFVRSLLGESNSDEEELPKSTRAVDKFECRKFEVSSSDGAVLELRQNARNELESRVAERSQQREKKGNHCEEKRMHDEGNQGMHEVIDQSTSSRTNVKEFNVSQNDYDAADKAAHASTEHSVLPVVELPIDKVEYMRKLGQTKSSSGVDYTIYDYGGQEAFDSLHSLFFTKSTSYIVVFNMFNLYMDDDEGVLEGSELKLLESWIERVVMYTLDVKVDGGTQIAPILLVGTHHDRLVELGGNTHDKEMEIDIRVKQLILKIEMRIKVRIRVTTSGDNCFFAVNNIKPSKRDVFTNIINSLERGFENAPHVQQQVSLAWIKCCDDFLSKAMDDNVVSLTLKEASDIMQSYGISGGDVERSLSFFHEMGILFWVNDDRLRDVVVLDPFEAFVKPIRTIICDTEVHTDEEPHTTCKREWTLEYAWYTKGRLDALNLLPNLLEGWQSTQDVTIELMLKFELMVRLPENIYLIPSLLKEDASFATRRHNLLFFVTKGKLLEEDRGECHAERTVASKLGYIQSGFFHRVLVALINKSFALNVLNSSFYKDAATLSYGNVMYTIRSHKTHISLEVDETKVGSCVELASHVEGVICNVMENFKMSTFSVYPLLEYDNEKLLSYKNVR